MKFINLTPHSIVFYDPSDIEGNDERHTYTLKEGAKPVVVLESAGVARAEQRAIPAGQMSVNGCPVPVFHMEYGEPVNLPDMWEEGDDVYYIVSYLTAAAAQASGRGTDDLFMVAQTIRDKDGHIVGCAALSQL